MPVEAPPQFLIERTVRVSSSPATQGSQTLREPPRVYGFTLRQPAAEWVRAAINRIELLTSLRPGWDSYGAAAVGARAATAAVRFLLDHAYPEVAAPSIVPLANGGLQVEWHRGGVDVEISFFDGDGEVYVENLETGENEEGPLSQAGSAFSRVIRQLAA